MTIRGIEERRGRRGRMMGRRGVAVAVFVVAVINIGIVVVVVFIIIIVVVIVVVVIVVVVITINIFIPYTITTAAIMIFHTILFYPLLQREGKG